MFPPKRFDIFPPFLGDEAQNILDAFGLLFRQFSEEYYFT